MEVRQTVNVADIHRCCACKLKSEGSHFWTLSLLSDDAEEAPPADETDAQPVKRAAEEEEVGWCLEGLFVSP